MTDRSARRDPQSLPGTPLATSLSQPASPFTSPVQQQQLPGGGPPLAPPLAAAALNPASASAASLQSNTSSSGQRREADALRDSEEATLEEPTGRSTAPGAEVGQRLVLVRPDSTLSDAIAALVRHRLHRVYVVDDEERPVGVVTATDALRKLVQLAA